MTMTMTIMMTMTMTMLRGGQYAAAAPEAAGSARLAAAPASSGRDGFRGAESLRQPIASQDLDRRAVEVSRHLGKLVVVEEEEVMVTELGGEVEVDLEERRTLMC